MHAWLRFFGGGGGAAAAWRRTGADGMAPAAVTAQPKISATWRNLKKRDYGAAFDILELRQKHHFKVECNSPPLEFVKIDDKLE